MLNFKVAMVSGLVLTLGLHAGCSRKKQKYQEPGEDLSRITTQKQRSLEPKSKIQANPPSGTTQNGILESETIIPSVEGTPIIAIDNDPGAVSSTKSDDEITQPIVEPPTITLAQLNFTEIDNRLTVQFSYDGYSFDNNRQLPDFIENYALDDGIDRLLKIYTTNANKRELLGSLPMTSLRSQHLPNDVADFSDLQSYQFEIEYQYAGAVSVTKSVASPKGDSDFYFDRCTALRQLRDYFSCHDRNPTLVQTLDVYENFSDATSDNFAIDAGALAKGRLGRGYQTTSQKLISTSISNLRRNDFALSLWFKPATLEGKQMIVAILGSDDPNDEDNWFNVGIKDNERLRIYSEGSRVADIDHKFSTDTWHHILLSYNESKEKLTVFIDGTFQDTANIDHNSFAAAGQTWVIGGIPESAAQKFDDWQGFAGVVDEFALWNDERISEDLASEIFRQQKPWLGE